MRVSFKHLLSIIQAAGLLILLAAAPQPVQAGAQIRVTTIYDQNNTDTACSLREAVIAANENRPVSGCAAGTPGMDHIVLPGGSFVLTITGGGENAARTGDLDLTESVKISGAGMGAYGTTIYANDDAFGDRLIHVRPGITVYLDNLRLQGGSANYVSAADPAIGAGIFNENSFLYLTRVSLVSNNSLNMGGGIGNGKGSYLEVNLCRFSNNSAKNGGGIFNEWVAVVNNSLFDTNTGTISGGGFKNNVLDPSAKAELKNVTFFGNTSNAGAGMFSDNRMYVNNATIVDNQGIGLMSTGSGYIRNSLIGLNADGENCVFEENGLTQFVSLGHNIEDQNSCMLSVSKGDQINVPSVGVDTVPRFNGGPTETLALLEGSPAIDAGDSSCPGYDQRWFLRPAAGPDEGDTPICDVGAYEWGAVGQVIYVPIISR